MVSKQHVYLGKTRSFFQSPNTCTQSTWLHIHPRSRARTAVFCCTFPCKWFHQRVRDKGHSLDVFRDREVLSIPCELVKTRHFQVSIPINYSHVFEILFQMFRKCSSFFQITLILCQNCKKYSRRFWQYTHWQPGYLAYIGWFTFSLPKLLWEKNSGDSSSSCSLGSKLMAYGKSAKIPWTNL